MVKVHIGNNDYKRIASLISVVCFSISYYYYLFLNSFFISFRLKNITDDEPASTVMNEDENEESLLRHTTLEAVALQLMECQHILDMIKPHLVSCICN